MSFFETCSLELLPNNHFGAQSVRLSGVTVFARVELWGPCAILYFSASADHGSIALGDVRVTVNDTACTKISVNSVVSTDEDMLKAGTATRRLKLTSRLETCTKAEDSVVIQVMYRYLPLKDTPNIQGFEGRFQDHPAPEHPWHRRVQPVPL